LRLNIRLLKDGRPPDRRHVIAGTCCFVDATVQLSGNPQVHPREGTPKTAAYQRN